MKYICLENGSVVGRYDSDIHPKTAIPHDAIEVSDEVWWQTINKPTSRWGLSNGGPKEHEKPGAHYTWDGSAWVMGRSGAATAAWERIKAERDRRTLGGGYQANGYWFHSDQLSRDQQLKLKLAGENVPRVAWKTMTGEFVQMTPELAEAIVLASGASDIAIFAAAEMHRAAMLASPDPGAYDYSKDWPLTFDEWAAQQEA